jgi:tRNA A37 threonylcarbamoyltransferase TsaD
MFHLKACAQKGQQDKMHFRRGASRRTRADFFFSTLGLFTATSYLKGNIKVLRRFGL